MVQISATPHRPPEVMVSLVNYLERVEQRRGIKVFAQNTGKA